jgi:hypothetical protein
MVLQFIPIVTAISGALVPILVTMGLITVGSYVFAEVVYPTLLLAGIIGIAILSYTEGKRLSEPNQRAIFTLGVPIVMLGFGMLSFGAIKLPFLSVVGVGEQTFTPMAFSLAEPLSSVSVATVSNNILIPLVLIVGVTLFFHKQLIKQTKKLFKSIGLKL